MNLCAVEGCGGAVHCRALCSMHYQRWRHAGSLEQRPSGTPPRSVEYFFGRTDRSTECWRWVGALLPNGYGRVGWRGGVHYAHRLAYELAVGPIPDGHDLDHLCRVRDCIRPDHLEPVTRKENLRRGVGAEVTRQRHAARRMAVAVGGQ